MRILVTGAAGFVGSKFVHALAARRSIVLSGGAAAPIDEIVAHDLVKPPIPLTGDVRVVPAAGDLSDRAAVEELFVDGFDLVVHLAAVVSGQAEEDFDLGYRVNLDGTLNLLSECRRLERPPVFVFASSTAVYGGDLPERVADSLRLTPTTSYGTQKAVGELLVNDFSRKGFIDGRAFRFPTVVVRPGAPNRALSSFVSSIIRDPLQGREAVCPVADDVRVFILSPRMLIRNLVHGVELPAETLGLDRAMTFPGLRVSTGEILGALRDIAGNEVADRIVKRPDRLVAEVVSGWPGDIASERARALGFVADTDVRDIITAFIEDELDGGPSVER